MGASRPTDARWVAVVRFRGSFRKVCRGGIYCARRRVSEANRRTAAALRPEIPPGEPCAAAGCGGMGASRPTDARWVAVVRFRGSFRKVCRGGIYCARRRVSEANRRTAAALRPEIPPGALRRRRVPGTMQASSPTEVCYNAGPRFLGWPRHSPSSVGADSISARGRSRRRGVRRDEGIPPYGRPVGCGCPVSRVMFGRFVGEGHAPPAGPCRTANIHGRAMALPYEPAQMPPPSGWCETQNLFVEADSISARGHSRRRRAPGTISGLRAGPAARLASETRLRAQCKHRPLQGVV